MMMALRFEIDCEGERHQVEVDEEGNARALQHEHEDADLVLATLGDFEVPCLTFLETWQRHPLRAASWFAIGSPSAAASASAILVCAFRLCDFLENHYGDRCRDSKPRALLEATARLMEWRSCGLIASEQRLANVEAATTLMAEGHKDLMGAGIIYESAERDRQFGEVANVIVRSCKAAIACMRTTGWKHAPVQVTRNEIYVSWGTSDLSAEARCVALEVCDAAWLRKTTARILGAEDPVAVMAEIAGVKIDGQ